METHDAKKKLNDLTEKAKTCQKAIRDLENQRSTLQGKEQSLQKQLKDEFGIETVEEAQKIIEELEASIASTVADITKLENELDEVNSRVQNPSAT